MLLFVAAAGCYKYCADNFLSGRDFSRYAPMSFLGLHFATLQSHLEKNSSKKNGPRNYKSFRFKNYPVTFSKQLLAGLND